MSTRKPHILFLLLLTFLACSDDDEMDPCGFFISTSKIVFNATQPGEPQEIFKIVQDMPMFGDSPESLEDYLLSGISICHQDLLDNGSIVLILNIEPDGKPFLKRVLGSRVHEKSYLPFIEKIEAMPNWIPGKQRDNPVLVQVNIGIRVTNGKLSIHQ